MELKVPTYEIGKQMEFQPFKDRVAQQVLTTWCAAHDGIVPSFDTPKADLADNLGKLKPRADGKQNLILSPDMQLGDLVKVIMTVDADSFKNGKRAYKGAERAAKLSEMGRTFEQAAIYMASRVDPTKPGIEVAEDLILNFYKYGQDLQATRNPSDTVDLRQISTHHLTDDETQTMDKWLAGDSYTALMARAGTNPSEIEDARKTMLEKYFRVSSKVLQKEALGEVSSDQPESPTSAFLRKTRDHLTTAVTAPELESSLDTALYDRGMETLMEGMKAKISEMSEVLSESIHEKLNISSLKARIDQARLAYDQAREGDKAEKLIQLGRMELIAALAIQSEVSKVTYGSGELGNFRPTSAVDSQTLNCVGFSMLGGSLFREVGIKYLSATVPEHSTLMLVTSDNTLRIMDMQDKSEYRELTGADLDMDGVDKDGVIRDIVTGVIQNTFETGSFRLKSPSFTIDNQDSRYFSFALGDRELQAQMYSWLGHTSPNPAEAERCFRRTIELDPKNADAYCNLGKVIEDPEEQKSCFRRAIELDPKCAIAHNNLGTVLTDPVEKAGYFYRAIELDPKNADAYGNLGLVLTDPEEKESCFRRAIKLDTNRPNPYFNLAMLRLKHVGTSNEVIDLLKTYLRIKKQNNDTRDPACIRYAESIVRNSAT